MHCSYKFMMAYAAKCKVLNHVSFVYLGPQHWARGGTNILIKIKKDENSKKIINKVNVKYKKQIYAISLS